MDAKVTEIWKDNLKACFGKITSLNNWLLVLALTVIVTFILQYSELKKQKVELKKYDLVLDNPWNKLRQFYEESNGHMENYYTTHAMPWYKLCFTTFLGMTKLNSLLQPPKKDNPGILSVISEIAFTTRALMPYTSNLTKIISAQKNSKNFYNLGQEELTSLIDIFNFDSISHSDSFMYGIGKADTFGVFFENNNNIKILTGKKRASPDMINILQFAENETNFKTFESEMFLQDIVFFGDYKHIEYSFKYLKNFIKGNKFENLFLVQSKRDKAYNRIIEIESGKLIEIPLIKMPISLILFVILSGIINLLIITYALSIYEQTAFNWKKYATTLNGLLPEAQEAYFRNWTLGINNIWLFTFLYSLFLSSIAIASLIFATLLNRSNFDPNNKISTGNFVLISAFMIVNFIFSLIVSNRYFKLKELPGKPVQDQN